MKRPFYGYAYLTATWSTAAGWGGNSDLVVYVPREGFYEIKTEGTAFANAANSDAGIRLSSQVGVAVTGIANTERNLDMVSQNSRVPFSISTIVYLKGGSFVIVETDENSGDVQIEQPTYVMIKEI
jgi:hypothetical protein